MKFEIFHLSTLTQSEENITVVEIIEGKDVQYLFKWSTTFFKLNQYQIDLILNSFFSDNLAKPLGASMTEPPEDGLGYYIQQNIIPLTARFASVIASFLVFKNKLTFERIGNNVELIKV